MELHKIEKQLILYTKNNFKRIDYKNDLKFFAAKLYYLESKDVELYSIIHMVTNLYQKLVDEKYIRFDLHSFLQDGFKKAWRKDSKKELSYEDFIYLMLGEIQGISVANLDLGEADISILQEKEKSLV